MSGNTAGHSVLERNFLDGQHSQTRDHYMERQKRLDSVRTVQGAEEYLAGLSTFDRIILSLGISPMKEIDLYETAQSALRTLKRSVSPRL